MTSFDAGPCARWYMRTRKGHWGAWWLWGAWGVALAGELVWQAVKRLR